MPILDKYVHTVHMWSVNIWKTDFIYSLICSSLMMFNVFSMTVQDGRVKILNIANMSCRMLYLLSRVLKTAESWRQQSLEDSRVLKTVLFNISVLVDHWSFSFTRDDMLPLYYVDSGFISRFKSSTTHRCVTRHDRVNISLPFNILS